MRPTRRAILVAAIGLAAALLPAMVSPAAWPLWLAVFVTGSVAIGLDGAFLPARRTLRVSLDLPATAAIGETLAAHLVVTAPTRRPLAITSVLDLSALVTPVAPRSAFLRAGRAEFDFELRALRRGVVKVERAWVQVTGPLGLLATVAVLEIAREALIVADLRPVHRTALRFASDRHFTAGSRIERYVGDGTELDSLREHQVGDDPRWIDWKGSARHHRLITRQFRAERNQQVILALDSGRLMAEPLDGVPKLDHAVTAALVLAFVSLRAGDRVGWFDFAGRVGAWAEPESGLASFGALRQHAARLDYSEAETNYTLALTSLAQRLRRRSLVVVLTDFVDSITAELMIDNLDRLARRHLLVFVAIEDPALGALATAPPNSPRNLHRAVVAGGLLRERELVRERLRRRGIEPLGVPPGEVHPRLINTYLEIKRRERL
ncbi:MAG: DUF58 domain-containing protein [Thermoanaerobaculia bacterium]|nr:DUF58 domain-containing protein [Thermoanaerobaculia bacterium]